MDESSVARMRAGNERARLAFDHKHLARGARTVEMGGSSIATNRNQRGNSGPNDGVKTLLEALDCAHSTAAAGTARSSGARCAASRSRFEHVACTAGKGSNWPRLP
jgi:hypothetical protein